MDNPGLPSELWAILDGRLWHATSVDGLSGIIGEGAITVVQGRYMNSFAKMMAAVSLFDFGPSSRDDWGQFSNWTGWFGFQQDCGVAVWLQIDREATIGAVLDAGATHRQWLNHLGKQLIPGVEALHVGPIPKSSVASLLLIDRHDKSRFRHSVERPLSQDEVIDFAANLPPEPPDNPILRRLRPPKA